MANGIRITIAVLSALGGLALGLLWHRSYMWSGRPYPSIHTAEGRVFVRFTGNLLTDPISFAEMRSQRSGDSLVPPPTTYYDLIEREPRRPWWKDRELFGFACFEEPNGGTWLHFHGGRRCLSP